MYNRTVINRKILYCGFAFVFVALFTMTLAYAALSVTLNINGAAEIVASNWDIHLENPKVRSGSISDAIPTITGGNTMNFNVSFELPGDYYEFTVDVVNDGDIDAMIDNVIKTPELTAAQAKYIRYEISYLNGNSITESQGVPAKSSVPIKVRIEYRDDISSFEDLPSSVTSLSMSISLTYVQADETITSVPGGGKVGANGSLDEIGTIVTIGTEQFYTIGTEGDNVKLLTMYNLYVGGDYTGDTWVAYGNEATGMQENTMKGWYSSDTYPHRGITAFSSEEQKGTNYSDYNGSLIEEYVNNYKNILESYFGVKVIEARLITLDELVDPNTFACSLDDCSCRNSRYHWIYSTSYWTSVVYDADEVWSVYADGEFHYYYETCLNAIDLGVRPVIVVPKYAITGEVIPN